MTDDADTDDLAGRTGDERIIAEAKKRFERCEVWESDFRKHFVDDIRFCEADTYNMWQWPKDARDLRELDAKPCMTINQTRQHCLQVENDMRQHKASVKVRPIGNGATYEASQVYEGVVRHIEYISNAVSHYQWAGHFQIRGGIGYWRVVTDWSDNETYEQDIFIRRVQDPLGVYIDPDIQTTDGSDARFAFVFDDMLKEEAEKAYPKLKGQMGASVLGNEDNRGDDDHVRIAEYYRVVEKPDRLIVVSRPDGSTEIVKGSELGKTLAKAAVDNPANKYRDIVIREVEWFLIVGDKIADRTTWIGSTIPIVRVVGEETVIEGKMDRKGHVRALIDPQRNLNYWTSEAATQVALQTKTPWVGPMEAFEDYEDDWATANIENKAWLPYKHVDDEGRPIPAPQRTQPPVMAQAFVQGIQLAQEEMRIVSGQYQAVMGSPSNETSGIAIQQRQRQGDNATYHYIDHFAGAIRATGKILVEIIPKVYASPGRVLKIMGDDGTETEVTVDPTNAKAWLEHTANETDEIKRVLFNPTVGRYDVEADVGPDFATRRQEAFNALTQVIAQNKELTPIVGDLLFKSADFFLADEIGERLRRMAPPQALGEGPSPGEQQLTEQLKTAQALIAALGDKLKAADTDQGQKAREAEIKAFEAATKAAATHYDGITKRLDVLLKALPDPALAAELEADLARAEHASGLKMLEAEHGAELAAQQPQPEPAEV